MSSNINNNTPPGGFVSVTTVYPDDELVKQTINCKWSSLCC